ncbi:hypothetical protein [Paraburkholderia sp. J8-2]|uniref:hypothetical protein n=1 Tax=Paraburkholderia sp. J8-2 TaxID=2805440 RepID=UPI002AB67ABC|nr:hypothetical protein [Paraburkholderia sp. J8-2]
MTFKRVVYAHHGAEEGVGHAYQITLSRLRLQRGDLAHFVTMAQIVVSTSHLFGTEFGKACIGGLTEAHDALERSLRVAVASDV